MALNLKAKPMIPVRDKVEGQALIEFATNLINRFIIFFIRCDRLFRNWTASQNPASATGRHSLNGQFETEFLFEFPVFLYTRVNSLGDDVLRYGAGQNPSRYPCTGALFLNSQFGIVR